jgi:hypothetical protein
MGPLLIFFLFGEPRCIANGDGNATSTTPVQIEFPGTWTGEIKSEPSERNEDAR